MAYPTNRMDPEATAQAIYRAKERGLFKTADALQSRFESQAIGDDVEDFRRALSYLAQYGVC